MTATHNTSLVPLPASACVCVCVCFGLHVWLSNREIRENFYFFTDLSGVWAGIGFYPLE